MNRKFIIPPTPAKARLLVRMAYLNKMPIDDSLRTLADRDCISDEEFATVGIDDLDEQQAVQFVLDTNFRCGIPTMSAEVQRGRRIIAAAMKFGKVDEFVVLNNLVGLHYGYSKMLHDRSYDALLPHRHKLLLMDIDLNQENCELVSKMFPRIVITGSMAVQYAFSIGVTESTTSRMGSFLYPAVVESFQKTKWKKNTEEGLIAMGVFPYLLHDIKVERRSFCVPSAQNY